MPDDFYDLLGVPADADEGEVKRAFREQAREYHPDRNDDEQATEQFQVLKKAKEVLADPEKREVYDRLGHRRYVADRLGGLPGIDVVDPPNTGGRRREDAGTDRSTGRRRSTPDPTGTASQPTGWGSGSSGTRRRRRRYYRTAPDAAIGPGRLANELAVLAAACYAVGLWRFFQAERSAVDRFVADLGQGGEVATAALLRDSIVVSQPLEFATGSMADPSIGLLFPLGSALLPVAAIVAAYRIGDGIAWAMAAVTLGPLVGFGLAGVIAAGLVTPQPWIASATGTTLGLFAGGPALAGMGWIALIVRGRR